MLSDQTTPHHAFSDQNTQLPYVELAESSAYRQHHSDQLRALESHLQAIADGSFPAFTLQQDREGHSLLDCHPQYRDLYHHLNDYLDSVILLPTHYLYSDHLNVFIHSCEYMGILDRLTQQHQGKLFVEPHHLNEQQRPAWCLFNDLIQTMMSHWHTYEFRARHRSRLREAQERFHEYRDYINALFANHDRLIVLRIDLAYQKQHGNEVSLPQAKQDLDRLLTHRRNNRLFDHLKGYIVKTEYGIEKGIHFHAIFFLHGSERDGRKHIFLTQQIGEHWKNNITKGTGLYWNCNARSQQYAAMQRLGIGLLHWSHESLINNLHDYVLNYICKTAQYFRSPQMPGLKMMRRGKSPEARAIKLGRPRHAVTTNDG